MKPIFASLIFMAGSYGLAEHTKGCSFHLSALGGPNGTVVQLNDGQNRIGQLGLPRGQYSIDEHGGLSDSMGRGCVLTPPTKQWQCDTGAPPTRDFAISCDGSLTFKKSPMFYSCPTGDHGGWNIYGKPVDGQKKCVPITLRADSCNKCSPSSSTMPITISSTSSSSVSSKTSSTPTSSYTPPAQTGKSCPRQLTGHFEFPHLIIPIDSSRPDFAHGTAFNGTMTATISSIFNFDVPASDHGRTCTLEFLFPMQDQLETSAYEFSGSGRFHVSTLRVPATEATTFNSAGAMWADLGVYTFTPDSAVTIGSWPCYAPSLIGVKVSAENGTSLNYFQDFNPCPIGLYVQVS